MPARQSIADLLSALLTVYTLVVLAWVLLSFAFSLGLRFPYSRWSNALLDFLRDVSEPYLRIFRRFVPMIGPLDLSPLVALLALQLVGGLVVAAVAP